MRTNNPVLNARTIDSFRGEFFPASQSMTIEGAATKTLILLGLCIATASMTFSMTGHGNAGSAMPWMLGGLFGSLIFGMVTSFKPNWAPVTAPLYALTEGLLLGAISGMYERMYNGIIAQAALATIGTMAAMLFAYKTGVLRATNGFILGVTAATGGIALMYLLAMLFGMFGMPFQFLHQPSLLGLGISMVIVIVAALNLIIDFHTIEQAAQQGAPKYFEWYSGFALMVTLVWLYIELVRLLAMFAQYTSSSRD